MADQRWVDVLLTWPEMMLAVQAGTMRRISAIKSGRQDQHPDAAAWDRDINGALAEMAVAKWADAFWSGTVGRIDLPDVGVIEVRSKTKPGDRLVIRADDRDSSVYVSVLVQPPHFRLCGWLLARDARRPEWLLTEGRHFVGDEHLKPMGALDRSDILLSSKVEA